MTNISCYVATNMSKETEVKNFYKDLKSLTKNVPAHNVPGDLNAQVRTQDNSQ